MLHQDPLDFTDASVCFAKKKKKKKPVNPPQLPLSQAKMFHSIPFPLTFFRVGVGRVSAT